MACRQYLSSVRVTASDDESEDEHSSTHTATTDRDPKGVPLRDRTTGSDDRLWVGSKRVVERRVWGPQPYSIKQIQHELAYHKKAGSQNGVPHKAGDPDLLEMDKHLKSESKYPYMRLYYPCANSRCEDLKACLLSENCDIRPIIYDPRKKLPYTTGCKLRVSGLVEVENEQ